MEELVRRALLGDKKCQDECTKKRIVLPCPFCGSTDFDHGFCTGTLKGFNYMKCETCGCKITVHESQLLEEAWNTRSALSIGKCDDCNHRYENELNEYVCEILDICSDDNFCCSYFEPKECEENAVD